MAGTDSTARRWAAVVAMAVVVGVVSLMIKVPWSGEGPETVRLAISRLTNSGTLWAAIGIVAGWALRHRWHSPIAGIVAGELALAVHDGLGAIAGFPQAVWTGNGHWCLIAAVAGAPLGLVGLLARRAGRIGLAATLVVPLGAIAEPLYRGWFTLSPHLPGPTRDSATAAGAALIAVGAVLAARALTAVAQTCRLSLANSTCSLSVTRSSDRVESTPLKGPETKTSNVYPHTSNRRNPHGSCSRH